VCRVSRIFVVKFDTSYVFLISYFLAIASFVLLTIFDIPSNVVCIFKCVHIYLQRVSLSLLHISLVDLKVIFIFVFLNNNKQLAHLDLNILNKQSTIEIGIYRKTTTNITISSAPCRPMQLKGPHSLTECTD
jgi:hypothetical protein